MAQFVEPWMWEVHFLLTYWAPSMNILLYNFSPHFSLGDIHLVWCTYGTVNNGFGVQRALD